ncbi:Uma2 family endonuclease [Alkalinema pantanalense CENA528]|uniref:Uma2 family endonuclease n=1 Tax=Alkalinema pantanalense TaxID=1620705 RepID=UPI003D6E47A5
MTTFSQVDPDLLYPDSDGQPMSDNTKQFRWIVTIKENLEILFADRADVFVAGDLLWYAVEGQPKVRQAPDAMVVFGRPKGERGSYKQWVEEGIAPQVVFEILSPGNTASEMARKREFYDTYGVEEYYEYDPDRQRLRGWIRQGTELGPISVMQDWVSPRLGIQFRLGTEELEIIRSDGQRFLASVELAQRAEQAQQRAEQAETQLRQVVQNLRQAGMPIEQIMQMTGMTAQQVAEICGEIP